VKITFSIFFTDSTSYSCVTPHLHKDESTDFYTRRFVGIVLLVS